MSERDNLLSRLQLLDAEANLYFANDKRLHVAIVGGSALLLLNVITRATDDIDVLSISAELERFMHEYDMNTNVWAYICFFPYGYEDRYQLVYQGAIIDFYAVSLEDIVIAKLNAGREVDICDITTPEILNALNWNKLEELATSDNELKASIMNSRQYSEFYHTYQEYVQRYRQEG